MRSQRDGQVWAAELNWCCFHASKLLCMLITLLRTPIFYPVLENVTHPLGLGLSLRKQGYTYTLLLWSFEGLENQKTKAGRDASAMEQIWQSPVRDRALNWGHHTNLHPNHSPRKKSHIHPRGKEERTIHSHHLQTPHLDEIHMWLRGKEPACQCGDSGSIPGSGRSPGEGNGNPLQHSCLGNPMDGGSWRATAHGVRKLTNLWHNTI